MPAGFTARDRIGRPGPDRPPTRGACATPASRPARPAPTRCRTRPTCSSSTPPGRLRARFPFGTSADAMTATLRAVAAASTSGGRLHARRPTSRPGEPRPDGERVDRRCRPSGRSVSRSSRRRSGPAGRARSSSRCTGRPAGSTTRRCDRSVQLTGDRRGAVGCAGRGRRGPAAGRRRASRTSPLLDIPPPGWWRLAVSATPGAVDAWPARPTSRSSTRARPPGSARPLRRSTRRPSTTWPATPGR